MSRKPPPTLVEAEERNLADYSRPGIYTFSNGTEYEGWAGGNCWVCRFYQFAEHGGAAGEYCAFEGAALLDGVTPELARMFGWTQNPKYAADYRQGWAQPEHCAFLWRRDDNDDGTSPPPAPTDPLQLNLIADPTEDAARITAIQVPADVPREPAIAIHVGGAA